MKNNSMWKDTRAYAVVEATILFPIIIMIFAGIVLLAMYIPTRMVLQQATQYAATALSTEQSDTWLQYDSTKMEFGYKNKLNNVYVDVISSVFGSEGKTKGRKIVTQMEGAGLVRRAGELKVECDIKNYVIYKEIVVTATREIPMPVNLSIVRFPEKIPITVRSTAVVQNGDEFVRNIDIAKDFISYLLTYFGLDDYSQQLKGWIGSVWNFLGVGSE